MMSISQITTTAYRQHKIIVKILTISQILAVLFLFSTTAFSQQADSRFRLGASFSADLTDRLSAGIGIEQRQRDNFHQFDKLLIEPEIKYAITEKHSLTATYRGWGWYEEGETGFSQWLGFGYSYNFRKNDWRIKFSSSTQYDLPEGAEAVNWAEQFIWRNKLGVKYSIFGSRFTPELRAEVFTAFDRNPLYIKQIRASLLVDYRITKTSSIEAYLLFSNEINTEEPQDAIIYGLCFSKSLSLR